MVSAPAVWLVHQCKLKTLWKGILLDSSFQPAHEQTMARRVLLQTKLSGA